MLAPCCCRSYFVIYIIFKCTCTPHDNHYDDDDDDYQQIIHECYTEYANIPYAYTVLILPWECFVI